MGNDFFSGEDLYISTNKYCSLMIGEKVMFGPQVMILGGNHNLKYSQSFMKDYVDDDADTKSIVIEKGVWVGARSSILSGATICEGAVVGANSLVSGYIPPFCIATGVPSKKFRSRFNRTSLTEYLYSTNSNYEFDEVIEIYNEYGVKLID
nr:acyltransferase [Vibrio sp. 10N.286.45.E10]PMI88852.1 hypothetical protein BCU34_23285 [Vibrio sp. 10N.286.45.E10]